MLSKSKFTRGTNCPKSLWLYAHKREEQIISEATKAIFSRGKSVGELAWEYFPDGKMAVLEEFPGYESARRTQELIAQGVQTIYEATFIYHDTLVAVDIMHKENGMWNMYEVKSTNSIKSEHFEDVAIQYYVVKGCGLDVGNAFLMHFNRDYVRRGDINVQELFTADSVMDQIIPFQEDIPGNIRKLFLMLQEEEPQMEMGRHCTNPYHCHFYDYCVALLPVIDDEAHELSSVPQVMVEEVREYLNAIEYPICHLDFETINPAVPLFDESRPYQQIAFQYSIHFQESADSEVKHYEYLSPSDLNIDPRSGLIPQMIQDTKGAATIFVYNISFERTRIREMMRDFPQYKEELQSIDDRLIDLIIPFRRKYYRTETMEGSSSMKKVLPALYPDLSYNNIEIQEGGAASSAFLDLYYCNDDDVKTKTRQHLLEYCHLDTLAMVKLLEKLREV